MTASPALADDTLVAPVQGDAPHKSALSQRARQTLIEALSARGVNVMDRYAWAQDTTPLCDSLSCVRNLLEQSKAHSLFILGAEAMRPSDVAQGHQEQGLGVFAIGGGRLAPAWRPPR